MKTNLRLLALLSLFLAPVLAVRGQILANQLVADINPGSSGSYPTNFFVHKGALYFSAYTVAEGRELWRYNATNVSLVTNINDTVTDIGGGVLVGNDSNPSGFTTFSNLLYFSAFNARRGGELWRYDGTNAVRVTDINPDANDNLKTNSNDNIYSSWPQELTVMNSNLFFSANSGTSKPNYELWRYNGNTAVQVANIHADSGSDFSSYPSGLTVFNGALYFMADDGSHGYELWKATNTGATLLADINSGGSSSGSYPKYFTAFTNKLFFQAYTAANGFELWRTDGTNTSLVMDLNPGANNASPKNLTVFGNALYFQASDGTNGFELWKYNGSVLTLVSNINTAGDSFPENLTVCSNQLYFSATDGIHGWELWHYDGTNAAMVADLNPSGDSYPESLTVISNTLFFVATTPDYGYEWWRCRGTNLSLAADINPGAGNSYPIMGKNFQGQLIASATDDGSSNWEPWMIWAAPFRFTDLQKQGDNMALTWQTAGGSINLIQSAATPGGPFTNLSDPLLIPGTGATNATYLDTPDVPVRFYRVIQP